MDMWRKLLHMIENALYPDHCIGCRTEHTILCTRCLALLPPSGQPPIGHATFAYRNPTTRKALWLLKYGGRQDVAEIFSKIVAETILGELAEQEFGTHHSLVVVAIPLSAKRLQKRGYNQSSVLARAISQELGVPEVEGLQKIRETTPQMKLRRHERLKNLAGAFVADPAIVKNKTVLILDDIITTGATLNEATRALYDAGAFRVLPFAIAH